MSKVKVEKTKTKKEENNIIADLDAAINSQFDDIINLSKVDGKVKTWYDTGIYALNYIMSKNLKAGVPGGRITSISGLAGTGKSLISATIMRDPNIDMVIILETEGGGHAKELIEFAGVDQNKVKILKAHTFGNYKVSKKSGKIEEVPDAKFPKKKETDDYIFIEGATLQVKKIVNMLAFNKKLKDAKILIILDSLGNLQSVREFSGTSDMGARSQDVGRFFRTFDTAFEKSNIAFVFTNKLYTNLGNIYDPYKETGGVNAEYNPSISIRLAEVSGSDEISDKDMTEEKNRRKTSLGSSLKSIKATIKKSRFGTEGRNAWFLFDFAVGPIKHSGLFTLLYDFDIIKRKGSTYTIKGFNDDKGFYKKDFIDLIIKNEEKNIELFQKLLDEREKELKEEKKKIKANDIEEIKSDDETENFVETAAMIKAMENDN